VPMDYLMELARIGGPINPSRQQQRQSPSRKWQLFAESEKASQTKQCNRLGYKYTEDTINYIFVNLLRRSRLRSRLNDRAEDL
jgi:hypothetical protein